MPSTYQVEEEKRARAREKVEAAARRGDHPRDHYSEEDLRWCFGKGQCEDALAALDEVAEQALAVKRRAEDGRHRAREVRALTDKILAEQDAQRRAAAEAEAKRRLGWEADQ